MRLLNVIFALFVAALTSEVLANDLAFSIPKNMKYFPEERKFSLNFQASTYLQTVSSKAGLNLYPTPKYLSIDSLMTDDKLKKSVLISANRRVNPEYLNRIYKHSLGYFFQTMIHGQQLSLFFLNFEPSEVQTVLDMIQKDLKVSSRSSIFLNFAYASERSETASGNSNSAQAQPTSNRPAYEYVFGEEFVGCGKGVVVGLNDLAKFPWDAAVSAGKGFRSLYNEPAAFWDRSVKEFKSLAEVMVNFRQYLGSQWSSFRSKPPKEQSEFWCNYLGANGLIGTAGKAAKAAGWLSKENLFRASSSILEFEKSTSQNLLRLPRGTPEVAAAENEKVLSELRHLELPHSNPQRLAELEKAQVDELLEKVKKNPVAEVCKIDHYEGANKGIGFCFGRAMAAHIEALKMGLEKDKIKKVWAVGDLKSKDHHWGFHVVTIVKGADGAWWAIEPFLDRPITIDQWYRKMKTMDSLGDMRIYTTEAKRFGPASEAKYSPQKLNDDFYNDYFKDIMENFKQDAKEIVEKNKK